ncbi:M24 family metallopeptidase [Deferrisoma camini]|uniref:M24 family metallopeptidase n=1 Tax=Deferrisoma camini TaxID=1035120 RepID=UPI00046D6C4C|nr:Xaa-Pro peptidase family protein [Deferrisoma camini]
MTGDRSYLEEIRARVARLQAGMKRQGLGGALLVQNASRYWASGTMQAGAVVVPAGGDPVVFVRKDLDRARRESPCRVEGLASLRDLPARVREVLGGVPEPLGLEWDVLPVNQARRFQGLFEGVDLADVSGALALARAVKTPWEHRAIAEAARVVAEAVARVPELLRPGIPEIELAAAVEYELRRRGHGGLLRMRGFNQEIFYGHVMAGPTAAEPSFLDAPTGGAGLGPALAQGPSTRAIGPGEPVTVDLVGNHQGYLCDQTRIFCLGRPPRQVAEAFEAACAVQDAVIETARPGATGDELYRVARRAAEATPFADTFLGHRNPVSFVGHGIGLEVDEPPFLARGFRVPLEEGMVFALEPKFVIPGVGAVGVEDTFRVTATGVERITLSPRELGLVEI